MVGRIPAGRGAAVESPGPTPPPPPTSSAWPGKGRLRELPRYWHERRAQFWRRRPIDRGGFFFVGDSITEKWSTAHLAFPDLGVVLRGICGDTTRGILFRLQEDVLDCEPRGAVVMAGTNDLGSWSKGRHVAANLVEITARLADLAIPVYALTLPPAKPWGTDFLDRIKGANRLIASEIAAAGTATVVDIFPFLSPDGEFHEEHFLDSVHPNESGYTEMERALAPYLG